MQSFSKIVKEEIANQNQHGHCLRCHYSELAAALHMAGSIVFSGPEKISLSLSVDSASVARRLVTLLKKTYRLKAEIRVENIEKLGKHHRYLLIILPQPGLIAMLDELGVLTRGRMLETDIKPDLVKNSCCRASFVKGAFLTGGSITDPQKSTYHLELVTANEEFGSGLAYLLNLLGLKAKLSLRKDHYVVYLKESDAIARFLSIIGSHRGVLKLEEVRVIKNLRGEVNRRVNCETANLEKTLTAAWEQVTLIGILKESGELKKLSKNLRETAELRLEYPEATLKELAESHNPPLSKSAVNHRLRLLRELAKNFTEKAGI